MHERQKDKSVARQLNGGAATLALSVLCDSALEHYRGSFQNRAMYVPLAVASLSLGTNLVAAVRPATKSRSGADLVHALTGLTGIAGLCFHAYNIGKRPGGISWLNLFHAAPIGAPAALCLAALLGRAAETVGDGAPDAASSDLAAGRLLAAISSLGIGGTVGEAALLHFRGAYHNPAMMLPVGLPPLASLALGAQALHPSRSGGALARWLLKLTAALGFAGVGFHAFGIARCMGGWRNWSQNLLNGPPLPAPPSFTGLALAGLAALSLMEKQSQKQLQKQRVEKERRDG